MHIYACTSVVVYILQMSIACLSTTEDFNTIYVHECIAWSSTVQAQVTLLHKIAEPTKAHMIYHSIVPRLISCKANLYVTTDTAL